MSSALDSDDGAAITITLGGKASFQIMSRISIGSFGKHVKVGVWASASGSRIVVVEELRLTGTPRVCDYASIGARGWDIVLAEGGGG